MNAKLWVTCEDWTAGPFRDRQAADTARDRLDGLDTCPWPHAVTEAEVKPEPPWKARLDELAE
jgi:hypothetical protein